MKLYIAPGTCSMAPHIALREAELPVTYVRVQLGKDAKTEDGRDYRSINPMGAVPALELDSGELLTENAVLLQYIASLAPAKALMPEDGIERWRFLETLNFVATELHKSFSVLFAKPPEEFKAKMIEKIAGRFDLLEDKLGANQFLAGDRFTVADGYAFVMLAWARRFQFDLARWPKLSAYFDRMKQRPSVEAALLEEGLTA
ncbi:glutathione transferase GstA [Terricaulis sp.]|uniref:glutathione transferase GstA n=1 Tax=Terricaulis sp. TaxID=2768686 RepID=UPI003783A9E7